MFGLIIITYGMYAGMSVPPEPRDIITEDNNQIISEDGNNLITES